MVARRRKKKEDMAAFIPTPDRQLDVPSGWCITGHHDQCKFSFAHGKCGCSCHKPAPKRGRPRKVQPDE